VECYSCHRYQLKYLNTVPEGYFYLTQQYTASFLAVFVSDPHNSFYLTDIITDEIPVLKMHITSDFKDMCKTLLYKVCIKLKVRFLHFDVENITA